MARFSAVVRKRLAIRFQSGMPPRFAAPGTSMREPRTMSARPSRIGRIISGMMAGSYCPSGWSITTIDAPSRRASM
jgi:hypothetical protein